MANNMVHLMWHKRVHIAYKYQVWMSPRTYTLSGEAPTPPSVASCSLRSFS